MTSKLRGLGLGVVLAGASLAAFYHSAFAAEPARFDITQYGATADAKTVNTQAIQATIDQCAAAGGGTVVIPTGEFISGSLFIKPGVNIELAEGAVLKGSSNIEDYPVRNTRFEGHFEDWRMGLLNAEKADHLKITGPGILDGNGPAFWALKTQNGRPRLCFIRDSADVTVSGVHFSESGTWNLHLYNCKDVTVENCRFEIPDTTKGPTTDGTDVDSCQDVTIRGCSYSVDDDCVCIKGNRYDGLDQEPKSPPAEHVRVTNCTFRRGMGAITLGTEATVIRDIEMDHCTVTGNMPMLRIKMRPDTPGQDYRGVRVHDIKLDGPGKVLSFELTHGTKATPRPPRAIIRDVSVSDITGTFGAFGKIASNANTDISDIALKNINVKVKTPKLDATGVTGLTMENVTVNGEAVTAGEPATTPNP
jgi:alpha-L-rhamnosidase